MKTIKSTQFDPSSFGNISTRLSRRTAQWLPVALLLLCSLPLMAGINVMTNGPSIGGSAAWSLASAPVSTGNSGSFQDEVFNAANTNLVWQPSGNNYAQSVNVTNGGAYTYVANSTNAAAGVPDLRLGDRPGGDNGAFNNSVSGGNNDAIYLANNSSLTILETNYNNAVNPVLGNPLTVVLFNTNGNNFNIQSGSTLTINALITAGNSSSKSITVTGGGTFNYGGNPYAPSNELQGIAALPNLKGNITVIGDSTFMLSGVVSNGAGNGVVVSSANSLFNESSTGTIQGGATLTVNSGLATLYGTNAYTGLTTVVGPGAELEVFGQQALSSSSSLTQGGSTSLNSTLALATPDSYMMNQLQLSGIIIVTNTGSGPSTLTFANGGYQSGTATKQIQVETNTTVFINGATFDIIGATGNKDRNLSITANTGGAVTINAVLDNNGAFNGGVEKHGHGMLTLNGPNTYTGGTTNTGGGTLLVNGSVGGISVESDSSTLGGTGTITAPVFVNTNGTLAPGTPTTIGTLTINNNLDLAGNAFIKLNKGLSPAQSNDLVSVSGTLNTAGNAGTGLVTVTNVGGTALALGNKFKIFSKADPSLSSLIIGGTMPSGLAWSNNLATDGTIYVVTAPAPPTLNSVVAPDNTSITFSWSVPNFNFKLQTQTHTLAVGLSTNWSDYPGGYPSPVTVPINPTNQTRFFRLVLQ